MLVHQINSLKLFLIIVKEIAEYEVEELSKEIGLLELVYFCQNGKYPDEKTE
jgi:hypothetical protein